MVVLGFELNKCAQIATEREQCSLLFIVVVVAVLQYWGWNAGPCACLAGTLPLELCTQPSDAMLPRVKVTKDKPYPILYNVYISRVKTIVPLMGRNTHNKFRKDYVSDCN
jgi:hypothetical protein